MAAGVEQPKPSHHLLPSAPKLRLPSHACDAHFHVFGPRATFPFAEERPFTPADAPKEALFALHELLGIERGVCVQSTAHGHDNRVVEDLLAARPHRYRAVALLPTSIEVAELRRLDRLGFRGARVSFMRQVGKASPVEQAISLGARLAEVGWHLQILMEPTQIEELTPVLMRSAVPVVIDHMGRVDAGRGLDQPAFRALLQLMQDERFWVKVSGCERTSRQAPPFADAIPFARKLVAEFGDRTVWGTDWPHPNLARVPDDGKLIDLLAEIAPSEAQRQALLVDNPQRLYRFG
jgi:2-pyrone-4,6-dicarboxylate lactonase